MKLVEMVLKLVIVFVAGSIVIMGVVGVVVSSGNSSGGGSNSDRGDINNLVVIRILAFWCHEIVNTTMITCDKITV